MTELEQLTNAIANAARMAFLDLFAKGERYYYCTLYTTGEGHTPYISAWSQEALSRETASQSRDGKISQTEIAEWIKWSYADSPYCAYGEDYMEDVVRMYAARPEMHELSEIDAEVEMKLRLTAMEHAMKRLDAEGLFAHNQPREEVCILVEIMPPDPINTVIAKRLNDESWPAMQAWLEEAAE